MTDPRRDKAPVSSAPEDPAHVLLQRLNRLNLSRGSIALERLDGGISNHNFVVRTVEETYVARLCAERPLLGIDRRNEVVCQQAAFERGVAPELVHHEDGLLVSRFVVGQSLSAEQVREPDRIARLAGVQRKLHVAVSELTGVMLYFCPFQTVRTYVRTARTLGGPLPGDIEAIVQDVGELACRIAPFRPVLCHNDLMPGNLIDQGDGMRLIDWEYSGIGNGLFDLASAAANAAFTDDDDRALLAAYDPAADDRVLNELRILKAVSWLRESLWGAIQAVASDIDFDYVRYASENLEAYRTARERIRLPEV
jgi:thiamine kinase-like enzyme